MPDVKISALSNADALTGAEQLAALQGGKNVKVLASALRAGLAPVPEGWVTVTAFLNNWQDYAVTDTNYNRVQYRKNGDSVELRGLVKNAASASSSAILTLPAGYRPLKNTIRLTCAYFGVSGFRAARVDVQPGGSLFFTLGIDHNGTGPTDWLVLDGLAFSIS